MIARNKPPATKRAGRPVEPHPRVHRVVFLLDDREYADAVAEAELDDMRVNALAKESLLDAIAGRRGIRVEIAAKEAYEQRLAARKRART